MGLYCTTTSLETLWGGASFANLTATASEMIDQAEAEINKQLSSRYDISSATFNTTTSIPPMVTTLCKWLSLGYLYENTARGSKDAYMRADRYIKKAQKNLEGILNYEYNLVDAGGDLVSDNSTDMQVLSNTTNYHETFNEDSQLNWEPDGDKLQDIKDERS